MWCLIYRLCDTILGFRYLEEEGIFVGDKPAILPTNINILENRLLKEPKFDRAWFGLDGRVEILPNPLKTIITKSWVENELNIDENLHTYYSKAKIPGTEEKYLEVKLRFIFGFIQDLIFFNSFLKILF